MKKISIIILKKIEKYTRTDMLYLTKGGFWLGIGQIVNLGSIFALSIAFANLVSPEIYGTYKYILAFAAILSIFSLPGLSTALMRAAAKGDESTMAMALKTSIRWSLVGSTIALSASAYYLMQANYQLATGMGIIALALPFYDTLNIYASYLTGKRNFKRLTFYQITSQTVSVATLLLTLLLTDNVLFIVLAYFMPLIITRSIIYRLVAPKNVKDQPDKETLRYGKHLSLINVLGVVAAQTDTLLLWQLLGPQKIAIYAFALAIPEQIKGPLRTVSELAFPKFAILEGHSIQNTIKQLYWKLFLYAGALLAVSILYYFSAPIIFETLFPQYIESVAYSQVFMFASVGLIGTIPLSLLSAQKKLKEQYTFSVVQPILQIIAFIILIPLYGIWGAIIARVVMRVFYVSFTLYLMHRAFR